MALVDPLGACGAPPASIHEGTGVRVSYLEVCQRIDSTIKRHTSFLKSNCSVMDIHTMSNAQQYG